VIATAVGRRGTGSKQTNLYSRPTVGDKAWLGTPVRAKLCFEIMTVDLWVMLLRPELETR
jgi:hypothetical protein